MESALLIILLIIMWISLHSKISSSSSKIDLLGKEIDRLKNLLDYNRPVLKTEEKKPEEEPVASVEPVESITNLEEEKAIEPPVFHMATAVEEEKEIVVMPVPEEIPPLPSVLAETSDVEEQPIPALTIEAETEEKEQEEQDIDIPPMPAMPQPPLTAEQYKAKKAIDYEKYIGENLFGKIGILILVIGIGFFVKYAVDKDWIDETLRTGLGFSAGIVLLFIAWKLNERYRTFSSLLAGGAFAIFYVTVAMAYHYYGLFSQTAAFVILIIVTLLMIGLAILYDRRELAIIAIGGGFIAPFLVSSGSGNYMVLFTYVMILDLGMFFLSTYKKWGELPVICFTLTWIILLAYGVSSGLTYAGETKLTRLLLFSTGFYMIFLLSAVSIVHINKKGLNQLLLVLLTLNNFIFLGFAFWFLQEMNLKYNYKGVFTMLVAVVNLILYFWAKRKGQNFNFLFQTLLAIALTFISITIPIQLKGTFITLCWASEMVIMFWLFTRFRSKIFEAFSIVLPILTFISFLFDLQKVLMGSTLSANTLFLNGTFATGIFTGLAFIAYAIMQKRAQINNALFIIASCAILYMTFVTDIYMYILPHIVAVGYIQAFTALVLLGLTIGLGYKRFALKDYPLTYKIMAGISVALFLFMSYAVNIAYYTRPLSHFILWISFVIIAVHIVALGKMYYKHYDVRLKSSDGMTVYLSILSVVLFLLGTNNLLYQLSWTDELSAGFSITLGICGFILMAIGMRMHLRVVRIISLVTFGLVLVKLIIIDLWLLPTIGKVIVFIILGVLLLVLSFLYQKLKTVLFEDKRISPPVMEQEEKKEELKREDEILEDL